MFLNKLIYDWVNQDMAFQFKPRVKQVPHNQEREQEIAALKNYNLVLQKENQSKNQEIKSLKEEILRVSQKLSHQQKIITSTMTPVSSFVFQEKTQLAVLKKKFSELQDNYDSLLSENNILNFKLKNVEYRNSLLQAHERDIVKQSQDLKSNELKINELQFKLAQSKSQITQLKSTQSISLPPNIQYQASESRVEELQSQIRSKNQEIIRLSRQAMAHEDQIKSLRNQINSYLDKLKILPLQYQKADKFPVKQIVRYVQHQEIPILRAKLDQVNAINASIGAQINLLRNDHFRQVQILKDRQRKISILQQSNIHLQRELRQAIEAKKHIPPIIQQPRDDFVLKEMIYALQKELQEVKRLNMVIKKQNNVLNSQLDKMKERINIDHSKTKNNNPNLSKSPMKPPKDKIPRSQIIEARNTFNGSFNKKSPINKQNVQGKVKNTLKSGVSENIGSVSSANQRYNDLQRRINLLQNQNQVLKQQLIYEG